MFRSVFSILLLALVAVEACASGISPQYSMLSIQPGQRQTIKIAVLQTDERETEVSLLPRHCLIEPDGRLIFSEKFSDLKVKQNEEKYSAVPFIEGGKARARFDEWKEVALTVSVPPNTPPGEYYAALIMKPSNLGSILTVAVVPESLKAHARVASLETKWVDDQLCIDALLENNGSKTLWPFAKAFIKKGEKVLDSVALDVVGRNYRFVLHDNTRRLRGVFQNLLPVDNDYTAEVAATYEQNGKATLTRGFSVDRGTYLRQKGFSTIEVSPSSTTLAIPPNGFYVLMASVKNVDSAPVSVRVLASDTWATPVTSQVTLEPEEAKTIPVSLLMPRVSERIDTKIIFMPSRGRPYQTSIIVFPKMEFY